MTNSLKKFNSLALNYPNIPFAFSIDENLKQKFLINSPFGIVIIRNFGDGNKILELDEPDEFLNFRRLFKKVRYPPVLEYSP